MLPTTPTTAESSALSNAIAKRLDQLTKPPGSLGRLEELAQQVATIFNDPNPVLSRPTLVIFAGDHGIATMGVSAYPQAVTAQMVANFAAGGAAASVLARQNGLDLVVVDAGVAAEMPTAACLLPWKVGPGTANFFHGAAMSKLELEQCLKKGRALIEGLARGGTNIVAIGEMGIGNSAAAACLMAALTNDPLLDCIGRGTGVSDEGLRHKQAILTAAFTRFRAGRLQCNSDPLAAIGYFSGFEMAMMTGAYLAAHDLGLVVLVDGFIASVALLAAKALRPEVTACCIFSHRSAERAHGRLLELLEAAPLLDLGLRLGEGTGALLAYPLVKAAVACLTEMASFAAAGISGPTPEPASVRLP